MIKDIISAKLKRSRIWIRNKIKVVFKGARNINTGLLMIWRRLFSVMNFCLGSRYDPGIFLWRKADEKFKEDCLKTKAKYQHSFMVWSCMTSQGAGKLCIVSWIINLEVYVNILEHYLISSIEEVLWWFLRYPISRW